MKSIEHHKQLAREAKAEGCRHENADHHEMLLNGERNAEWLECLDCGVQLPVDRTCAHGRSGLVWTSIDGHGVETRECDDCGETMPLGPSNDCAIVCMEIRAAEIADGGYTFASTGARMRAMSWCEGVGYDRDGDDGTSEHPPGLDGFGVACDIAEWEAGYLAREIVDHDEHLAIDKVFAEAPATIREVQESLRGVVTP